MTSSKYIQRMFVLHPIHYIRYVDSHYSITPREYQYHWCKEQGLYIPMYYQGIKTKMQTYEQAMQDYIDELYK